eukprot:CAMPEP_0198215024 /NCGR_PEP_ID=MMETSP1445-20131203/46379_1 /TAXON_ID=36898 /ORGANISM="Pyramimonas sp., Strain CCMP2087" /LENGTH=88 /DNA_ID=CAMNT_0043890529 /DNA_START=183 /DNA_END=449 /DNA_ORIENTATION=-
MGGDEPSHAFGKDDPICGTQELDAFLHRPGGVDVDVQVAVLADAAGHFSELSLREMHVVAGHARQPLLPDCVPRMEVGPMEGDGQLRG